MKWLTNASDPRENGWSRYDAFMVDVDPLDQIRWRMDWLKDKWIGKPKATSKYSSKQLRVMGMVGIYAYDNPKIERRPLKIGHPGGSYEFLKSMRFARLFGRPAQALVGFKSAAQVVSENYTDLFGAWATELLERLKDS